MKTTDGSSTLINATIDEMYHSKHGAWSECRHVFLHPFLEYAQKNPKPCWRILDVGFGLGLNWLCAVNEWLEVTKLASLSAQQAVLLQIVSLENDPVILDVQVTREQLGDFSVSNEALGLLKGYKVHRKVEHPQIAAKLLLGDAMDSIDSMDTMERNGEFDVVFHDPFSPQKNPTCWSVSFFKELSQICRPGTLLLTYSVARVVKDALTEAGFEVKKAKGFGGKRERLEAIFLGRNSKFKIQNS